MARNLGGFNKFGRVEDQLEGAEAPAEAVAEDEAPAAPEEDTDLNTDLNTDADDERTEEQLLEAADDKHDAEVAIPAAEELQAEAEQLEQAEITDQVDNDGDGHDDRNGQFVDGNEEAAN